MAKKKAKPRQARNRSNLYKRLKTIWATQKFLSEYKKSQD